MQWFRNIKLSIKLPVLIFFMLTMAVGFAGYAAFRSERGALLDQGLNLVAAVAEGRQSRVNALFEGNQKDLDLVAGQQTTAQGISAFSAAWKSLGTDQLSYLQRHYITENPNPTGEKENLDAALDGSTYSSEHQRFHPEFRAILRRHGYYDIFLFNLQGDLIYSVFKELDFATNMNSGEWRDSGLALAFRGALSLPSGESAFQDYAPYGPSNDAPASFISQPVFNGSGEKIGVVAYQLPSEHVTVITNISKGLGDTGEVYVVGPDHLLRSDSRFSDEAMILKREARNHAIEDALKGQSGETLDASRPGGAVVVAYRPINVFGETWALVTEIKQSEILAGLSKLIMSLVLQNAGAILLFSIFGFLFSRSIANPLNDAREAMIKIADSDFDVVIQNTDRRDEVGIISATLDKMRAALIEGEQQAEKARFHGAALDSSSSLNMLVDANMCIVGVNQSLQIMLHKYATEFAKTAPGFEPDNVIGKEMDYFHGPALGSRVRALLQKPENLPFNTQIQVGAARFSLGISIIPNSSGGVQGYTVEWLDITEQFRSQAILESIDANQLMAEFGQRGDLFTANQNFAGMMGTKVDEAKGRSVQEMFSIEQTDDKQTIDLWERLAANDTVVGRFSLTKNDGAIALLEGSFSPISDVKNIQIGIVFIGHDVTLAQDSIAKAEALRKAAEQAQVEAISALKSALELLSGGDLTAVIDAKFAEEYEDLRQDFNAAVSGLKAAMIAVEDNANLIRNETADISKAANNLASRTESQAATLEETAAAMDMVTKGVRTAAKRAAQAAATSEETSTNAQSSALVMRDALNSMQKIEESSSQISKITDVIKEISFQTNLLALNAGIEAARAGEAGRGFSVVATEVRALAQRSSESALEIDEFITSSNEHVTKGVDLVGRASGALDDIVTSIKDISQNVSEIATSSREQSEGLVEINNSISMLDTVTQQNAAMFEETSAASQALDQETASLIKTIARFSTKVDERRDDQSFQAEVASTEAVPRAS